MSTRSEEAADQIVETAIIAAVTVGMLAVMMFGLGFQVGIVQVSWAFIIFVVLGVFTRRASDFNVGFALLTLGIIFTITDTVVPDFVLEPFTPFVDVFIAITTIDIRVIDGFQWLMLSIFVTALALGAKYRLTRQRRFIMPIVNRVAADFARFVDVYVTSARIIVLLAVTAGVIVAQQAGFLLGDLGNLAAQSPFVVSNLFALVIGFLSLGGNVPFLDGVPFLSELGPVGFIVMGLLAIAVAAAVRSEGTGPISQFVDRL